MLKKSKQRRYLVKKDKQWQQELETFSDSRDPEAIHRLRVAVKKIKAVAYFSQACSGNNTKKDFRLLRKMYKQAGAIRDAGNHLELLERVHAAPEFFKQEQQELQAEAAQDFVNSIRTYRKKGKKAARRLLADIRSVRLDCIRDWYAAELIKVSILLNASGDDLHQARKELKTLLYVFKLLPSRIARALRLDGDYLDKLQNAIGDWHDAFVVAATLSGAALCGAQAMAVACREKETAVRMLAAEFYHRARLDD